MLRNRRKSERQLLERTACIITVNSVAVEGVLLDVSSEGARIGGIRVSLLYADQLLEVRTAEGGFTASCRTVSRCQHGGFEIGLAKVTDTPPATSASILINSFTTLGDNKHVCIPLAVEGDMVRVQLLDSQEITVPESYVIQLTREERLKELCDSTCLNCALDAYGQVASGNDFVDRTAILNHEFGPPNVEMIA